MPMNLAKICAFWIFLSIGILAPLKPLTAQTRVIDSVRLVSGQLNGESKADALNELSLQLANINPSESRNAARQAFHVSEEIQYVKGKAQALLNEAHFDFFAGKNDSAILLLKRCIRLARPTKELELAGYGLAYLSVVYQNMEQLDSAKILADASLKILKDAGQLYHLSFLYNIISDYYGIIQKSDSQLVYLKKAWAIRLELKDKTYLPHTAIRFASYFIKKEDYKSALTYLEKSQALLGRDTLENVEINLIRRYKALIFAKQADYKKAIYFFDKARTYFESNQITRELADLLVQTTEVFEELGNYEVSLKNGFDALEISEKNNFKKERARALIRIAWSYYDLRQYELCKDFAQKALSAASSGNFQRELSAAYNLVALLLVKEKKYKDAHEYFKQALEIRARINDIIGMASVLSKIGDVYVQEGSLNAGLDYEFQSLKLATSTDNRLGMLYGYAKVGHIYALLNKPKEAEDYLTKAEELSRKIGSTGVMIDVYNSKRELYSAENNLSLVTKYTKLFDSLKDSLFNAGVSNRISILQNMYELNAKRQEIELQKTKLAAQQNEIRRSKQNLITITSSLGALLIFVILLLRNFVKIKLLNQEVVKQNEDLQTTKDEIESQNEELAQSNEEIMSQRDLLSLQNNKLDAARELIKKQNKEIKGQNKKLKKKVHKRTIELTEYIQQLEQFTFISSHNLRAPVARILGLGNLLELSGLNADDTTKIHLGLIASAREIDRVVKDLNLVLEIKRGHGQELTWINFHDALDAIKISLEGEIAKSSAIILEDFTNASKVKSFGPYIDSIFLNLIGNAIKYRRPHINPVINIKTEIKDEYVCLTFNDNGLGIDLTLYRDKLFTLYKRFHDHVEGKGIGLYLVKTQVVALGGKLEVESEINSGTTFFVYLKNGNGDQPKNELPDIP
jgi:signal transduction histidine kinase